MSNAVIQWGDRTESPHYGTGEGGDGCILNVNGCHTLFYVLLSTLTSPSVSLVEAQLRTMSPLDNFKMKHSNPLRGNCRVVPHQKSRGPPEMVFNYTMYGAYRLHNCNLQKVKLAHIELERMFTLQV